MNIFNESHFKCGKCDKIHIIDINVVMKNEFEFEESGEYLFGIML